MGNTNDSLRKVILTTDEVIDVQTGHFDDIIEGKTIETGKNFYWCDEQYIFIGMDSKHKNLIMQKVWGEKRAYRLRPEFFGDLKWNVKYEEKEIKCFC